MIRLHLADGTRVHINPAAIAYLQALPEPQGDDTNQPKTKIVLLSGEKLSVRQGPTQILSAAGEPLPAPRKRREAKTGDDHPEE